MRSYKAQKAALTRAINSKDPHKVIAEVGRFWGEYNDSGQPIPDDWHRWDIAARDAQFQLDYNRI